MSDLPKNLKYAATHEWAKLENVNVVRVGITDFAQQELGDLVYVELPEVGRKVKAKEQCAVVESVKQLPTCTVRSTARLSKSMKHCPTVPNRSMTRPTRPGFFV